MSSTKNSRDGGGRRANEALRTVLADLVERGQLTDGPALRKAFRAIARTADRRLWLLGVRGGAEPDGEDIAVEVLLDLVLAVEDGRGLLRDHGDPDGLVWGMVNIEGLSIRRSLTALRRGGSGRSPRGSPGDESPNGPCFQYSSPARTTAKLDDVAEELADPHPTPEELARAQDLEALFLDLFRDESWREIARGRLQGLTIEEIARRTGLSVSTVGRRLHAGLAAFEALWRPPDTHQMPS
ncbi:RNA polymerase sigma factor [Aquisphaera insulae]|uniref:RNA polymerase sigma factor n=1 Tax=Aquisphaera insulae TaxID=2712864 RepID=UPI0013E9A4C5|nr:sigma factor-like helix-turn-helix DNA-binding protein [Aquisphaera insulae]